MLADGDNAFAPKFSNKLHSTVTSMHDRNLDTCKQTRSKLKTDPIGLIVDLYGQAVKKNDSHISLGSVEFRNLTAKKVYTNEVMALLLSSEMAKLRRIFIGLCEIQFISSRHPSSFSIAKLG